jgi:hypothetical protein
MSILNVQLRKILQLFYANEPLRRSLLLRDIGSDARKEGGGKKSEGGDFYAPFWADAKGHVTGVADLTRQTEIRIAANPRRARLYPLLRDASLNLFEERLRWTNKPPVIRIENLNGQLEIAEVAATVRVQNVWLARVGGDLGELSYLIYPYFSEAPSLPTEGARLGLWAMSEALSGQPLAYARLVDLLRQAPFSPAAYPLMGDERDIFVRRYRALILEREGLKKGR